MLTAFGAENYKRSESFMGFFISKVMMGYNSNFGRKEPNRQDDQAKLSHLIFDSQTSHTYRAQQQNLFYDFNCAVST